MRPLELRLRNFRSFYGEGSTFDFRGRRLIGVVGPIGSGKSTILDAIAFALYGRTPRISLGTKSLIHQRTDNAAVSLRFEVDGEVWEAVRNLRRKGASQHALYRLADDAPEADKIDQVLLERKVNRKVEELLGLDYQGFGRSVLLAQGRFAEFLEARPGERDEVLKGVFGHERIDAVRELAKRNAATARHEIEKLDIRLGNARKVEEALVERRKELAEAATRFESLEVVRPAFEELAGLSRAAAESRGKAKTRLEELHSRAEELPNQDAGDRDAALAGQARDQLAEAEKGLTEAEGQLAEAERAVASEEFVEREQHWRRASELIVRIDGQAEAANRAAVRAVKASDAVGGCEKKVGPDSEALKSACSDLEDVETESQQTESALRRAEERLEEAHHADMAGSLRGRLSAGDDCPVCEQPVHEVPEQTESDAVGAQTALEEARSQNKGAGKRLLVAKGRMERAKAALEASSARLEEARLQLSEARKHEGEQQQRLDRLREEILGFLGKGDPAELLAAERAALDVFQGKVTEARKVREGALRKRDQAAAREQRARRRLSDLRTRIGALAALLQTGPEIPKDDPEAIRLALAALHAEWNRIESDLKRTIEEQQAEIEAAAGRLEELRAEHGVSGSIVESMAAVKARRDQAAKDIERGEEQLAGVEELEQERRWRGEQKRLNSRLASDLTNARFIRFLLDEERAVLAGLGSEHFERLSSGRYRFTEDGEFSVVDLNAAEAVRRADSLSGGETFLASLGLALGLAEMVGRRGGRLDAFFLDEGFGALDPEHLDLAMEGIESLVSAREQRLVVVVSHVPEVQNRIEDLIVLDNAPVTGDSKVVSGGAARPQPS